MREVDVDLERDVFTVHVGSEGPDLPVILQAVRDSGFEPSVVAPSSDTRPSTPRPALSAADIPEPVRSALDRARREGKLVLLDFHAPWCGPCRRMTEETFADDRVKALVERHFVLVAVDTDAQPEVARRFAVAAIPDVRALAPDGTEVLRVEGFRSAAEFVSLLAGALPVQESRK